ncbi:hypothetical protein DPX16_12587 [Anabarilius grahami]|uniref:Uncharacterized protein n=1 Tax=Anabarilius grahami TaxID=495550 RepID=A0A3N0YKM4_ANAGA|nr:hypothetical protein DPX16_12587 [Anabarilius grahami]
MEGKEKTTCSREPLIVPEDDDEQAYDSDGEPDFYFPQIMQDKTYPTITIVKDVPYIKEEEGSSCETTLSPNAQPFEPSGGVEGLDIEFEHVQLDGRNAEEVALSEKGETNLPVDILEENVGNSPVKELDSEAVDVSNDECTEDLITNRMEPVEGKRDGMRKENDDSEILIEENVERNGNTPVQEIPEPESRRSTRIREPPDRLTYTSLGNPLVMQSLLSGLNKAFTQALQSDDFPEVRVLTPNRSLIL